MKLNKLFKFSKTNKVYQVWEVDVFDRIGYAEIIVSFGQENGAIQEKITTINEGKNLGKLNETTYLEQAYLEAKSKWNKQLDKGYKEKKEQEIKFKPMLAQRFDKFAHKIKYPCFINPKLDGTRCVVTLFDNEIALLTRNNKEYKVLSHLEPDLKKALAVLPPGSYLDGELYVHGWNFQRLISAIKRDEESEDSSKIEYHLYDLFIPSLPDLSYIKRYEYITLIEKLYLQNIKIVSTIPVVFESEIHKFHQLNIKDGYEGSILRNSAGIYGVDKRSYDLQKVKDFQDEEFEIIGGELDKNDECVFICKTKDNKEFRVKPEGSHALRSKYYNNLSELIGQMLTVKFFEWTDDGIPRFPVAINIRSYE